MANHSLHHLIQSIAGAVAEAQDKVQRFQMATVRQYFDDDNRPVSVDVRLPLQSPDAKDGEERLVRVPLLSLVGSRLLTVKDMQIDFEVGLYADHREPSAAQAGDVDPDSPWPADTHTPLNVDMGVLRNGESGPLARVTIRVETQSSSEGMARLIHNLDKLI